MLFKRPSFGFTLLVTLPSVLFYGMVAILLGPVDLIFFRKRRPGPVGLWVKKSWSKWMVKAHGLRIHVDGPGKDRLSSKIGCIYASNHQSALDILAHILILPSNAHFVSKKELLWIPVFGFAARVVGTIFIDRSKGTKEGSLTEVSRRLREGNSIILYPEGTRSKDGRLAAFKRGAAVMAIQAQVPIVPITIFDSAKLCPKGQLSIEPGDIHIYIEESVPTSGLTYEDRYELTEKVHNIIQNRLTNGPQSAKPQSLLERA